MQRLIRDCKRQQEAREVAPQLDRLEKLIAEVSAQLKFLEEMKSPDSMSQTVGVTKNGHSSGRGTGHEEKKDDHQEYGNLA